MLRGPHCPQTTALVLLCFGGPGEACNLGMKNGEQSFYQKFRSEEPNCCQAFSDYKSSNTVRPGQTQPPFRLQHRPGKDVGKANTRGLQARRASSAQSLPGSPQFPSRLAHGPEGVNPPSSGKAWFSFPASPLRRSGQPSTTESWQAW